LETNRVKRIGPWASVLLLGASLLIAVPTAVAANPNLSATADGQRMTSEASARYTGKGIATKASDLAVYRLADGSFLVVPTGTQRAGDGVTTASQSSASSGFAALASGWQLQDSACFSRYTQSRGWMDTCYHHHKLFGDGSSTYDYHELHLFATASSLYPGALKWAWIESNRASGSPTQSWYDWDPGADTNTNCHNLSVGVQVGAFGISYGHDQCETWDITKYSTPGQFRNTWRGNVAESEREVAFDIASRVSQGSWAQWTLNWDFYAQ
jgi:hypothetical protein